jgi:ribonuclease-3
VGGAAEFTARLGLPIRNLALLDEALTHSSWLHEHAESPGRHNERLELLGDAVVNLAIASALHVRHPADDEGVLSARRSTIVSTPGLARLAERLGLGDHLMLGEGEARGGGRRRPSLLASAFEAVAGAIYLDQGWDVARAWIESLAGPEIRLDEPPGVLKSPKSRLQELTQRSARERPAYRVVEATGPDHQRRFVVEVLVDGAIRGVGQGSSRRAAETEAARQAIEALEGATRPARRRSVAARSASRSPRQHGPEAGEQQTPGVGE